MSLNMIFSRFLTVVSIVILLSACDGSQVEDRRQNSDFRLFSKCENTFVVSGSRKIYLFEHHPNSVDFDQLAVFDDWSPLSPYLDCVNNRVVVPYGARKEQRNNAGVAIIDLNTGTKIDYPVDIKGIQGIPIKYDNGLLLGTTLLKQTDLAQVSPSYGYLPPGESYSDRHGASQRLYTPTIFFDLSRLEFTQELDLDLGYSVIDNDILYAKQRGAITAIDLKGKTTEVLYEANDFSKGTNIPLNHLGVFLAGEYYMVLNRFSQKNPSKQYNRYDSNGIYKLVDGKMHKLSRYSGGDAVYLLGLDKKLYVFTQSLQVIEYDLETEVLVERSPLNIKNMDGYTIESVGYSHKNFIVALDHSKNDIASKVLLISRDFTQVSVAKPVDLRLISITTELAIDTVDSRNMQAPINQNAISQ